MNIYWIDPVNSDAQFLNLMTYSLAQLGVQVNVRSQKREIFRPPHEVKWVNFGSLGTIQQSIACGWQRYAVASFYLFDWLRAIRWIVRLQKRGPILITTNLRIPAIDTLALWIIRRVGIIPVIICHKPHPNFYKRHDLRRAKLYRPFFHLAGKILVMTDYTRKLLTSYYNLPFDRFKLFPHPHFTDYLNRYEPDVCLLDRLITWSEGHPVIGLISNYNAEHGFDNFFRCLPFLLRLIPKIKILICSNNSKNNLSIIKKFETIIENAGFTDEQRYIHFGSYSYPELLSYLKVCSIIVIPYHWATQSGVIPLASGFGIPVVTTNVGGLPEMVAQGISGEVVPPNDPEAMALACRHILDSQRYEKYCQGALNFAKNNFNPKKGAQIIIDLLNEINHSCNNTLII